MNEMGFHTDRRGIVLTDNVDLDFLKAIKPRYNEDFCKFTIHKAQNRVCVGMDIHAQCDLNNGEEAEIYGGNIFFEDGHIEYESTLNIYHNIRSKFYKTHRKEYPNPRIILDPELIEEINACLLAWISL